MKKLISILAAILFIGAPLSVFAAGAASSVFRDTAGFIRPLILTDSIKALFFTATSTTQASTFPYASTTAFSFTSTSTGTAGINISAGCFAISGTCVTGVGTVGAGTTGQNAYYSALNTVTGTSSLFTDASGKIGIGTTSPTSALHVESNISNGARSFSTAALASNGGGGYEAATTILPTAADQRVGSLFFGALDGTTLRAPASVSAFSSELWTSGVTNLGSYLTFNTTPTGSGTRAEVMRITGAGNVAIGTTTAGILTAAGRTYLTIQGSSSSGVLELTGGNTVADGNAVARGILQWTDNASQNVEKRLGAIRMDTDGSTAFNRGGAMLFFTKADNTTAIVEAGRFNASGNLGVGTTTPFWRLTAASSTGPQLALVDGSATSNAWTFRSISNSLYIATSTPSATSSVPAITINPNGFVGIASSSPGSTFSVDMIANLTAATSSFYGTGGINLAAGCFAINNTCLVTGTSALGDGTTGQNAYYSGTNTVTGTSTIFTSTAGLVGIGTTSPSRLLTVEAANTIGFASFNNGALASNGGGGVEAATTILPTAADQRVGSLFFGALDGATLRAAAAISGFSSEAWSGVSNLGSYLTFNTTGTGSGTRTERMRITPAGFLGIGTTTPTNLLSISGGSYDINSVGGQYRMDNVPILFASSTNALTSVGASALANYFTTTSTGGETAVGFQALGNATSSVNDTAMGYQALKGSATITSVTGQNTGVGYKALTAITSGFDNTALGYQALSAMTTGQNDIGIGNNAGLGITNSNQSIAIGNGALNAHNGSSNVAIGQLALGASGTGNLNVGIGNLAGFSDTSGAKNTFLGASAASTTASGSQNIALCYDCALPSINGSNQLNIGNIIFGTGLTGEGATVAGSIGIGTTTPTSLLTINGHIGTDGAPPVLSLCGTSPAITTGSTDTAGELTQGTISTGCTITFATAYTRAPFCTISDQAGLTFSYTISASALTVTNIGALSSTAMDWHCTANDR